MRLWLIPSIYVGGSVLCGLVLPRMEQIYLAGYAFDMSVASAQAMLSAVASGMMALTGIVFAMAFFMVQFSAIAYSPRLDIWFARDRTLYHSLRLHCHIHVVPLYSCVDRPRRVGKGAVLFHFDRRAHGHREHASVLPARATPREVIREAFQKLDERRATKWTWERGSAESVMAAKPMQTVVYSGRPRVVTKLNMDALIRQAQQHGATIVMACAVGDTLIDGSIVLYVHGAKEALAEKELLRSIQLGNERTFEQDPKYPIRLLVDIAIKALSPRSMIRLPQCRPSIRSRIFCAVSAATTSMPALPEIQRACCVLSSPCRHGRIIWRSPSTRFVNMARAPCRSCVGSEPHSPALPNRRWSTPVSMLCSDTSNISTTSSRVRHSMPRIASWHCRRTAKDSVFRGGQKINLADKCMLHCRAGAGSPARSRKPMLTHPNSRRSVHSPE